MNVDIRLPIGLMFSLVGAILTVYGIATYGSNIYTRSLGQNVNLFYGVIMLVFGLVMLLMAVKAQKSQKAEQAAQKKQ
jgi:uncharacterized membrane protein HdeD (DUF308 family)